MTLTNGVGAGKGAGMEAARAGNAGVLGSGQIKLKCTERGEHDTE